MTAPVEVLTVPEAAARLDMSADTLYRLARRGDLPAGLMQKIGGRWKVSARKLQAFVDGDLEVAS